MPSPEMKAVERCALIWFAICSQDVFDAVISGKFGALRRVGLRIDEKAFQDLSNLLSEKPAYQEALLAVREMWMLQCSPPPCFFESSSYDPVMQELQRGLRPGHTRQ